MSSKLDRSLDDLSNSERRSGGGARRGGRGGARGGGSGRRGGSTGSNGGGYVNPLSRDDFDDDRSSGPVRRERGRGRDAADPYSSGRDADMPWSHDRYEAPPAPSAALGGGARLEAGNKVLVSNLDPMVFEKDIQEIFQNLGQVTKAVVHYDSERRSLGTAEVTFANAAVATKAVEEYDGAEVDGRPMYVKLIGSVIIPQVPRVVQKRRDRVTAPTTQREAPRGAGGFREDRRDREDRGERPARRPRGAAAAASAPRRGGRAAGGESAPRAPRGGGARGGKRGGGAAGGGRGKKEKDDTPVDKDALDKELEAYQATRGGSQPAAASTAAAAPPAAAAGQPAAAE